jgi:hypothetical protein
VDDATAALAYRHQRPIRDHAVDLGDPLYDPDAYLRGLRVAVAGLIVIGVE